MMLPYAALSVRSKMRHRILKIAVAELILTRPVGGHIVFFWMILEHRGSAAVDLHPFRVASVGRSITVSPSSKQLWRTETRPCACEVISVDGRILRGKGLSIWNPQESGLCKQLQGSIARLA